ncbi:MAG: class I SAM-dependent rRNA methyltransferase [Saprospiraceae bacterium]|nr:class I SAM-dependent rRNA methyltransferase [Saprospiraceae bacterium]
MVMQKVVLKAGKDEFVRRFHPWIFSGAVARVEGDKLADGDVVEVTDHRGNTLGIGHFHHGSIAVRLVHFGEADVSQPAFWVQKFQQAWQVRQVAGLVDNPHTDCFRLSHGEGDGMPGLVVDIYGDVAVMQCHSIGMHRQREVLTQALRETLGNRLRGVYDKSAEALPGNYAAQNANGWLWSVEADMPVQAIVRENGIRFKIDWQTGQKTGFFLDQRDNRQLLSSFAAGKSVLNTFCYTGGFSCYALKAGAERVVSVDVSAKAMDLTAENILLNAPFTGIHEALTEDVLRFFKHDEQQFDVVVVDPPAFAKSLDKRHNAVQGYKRLNEAAIRHVKPGGILFTFSCSQVVDRELFYHTIAAAAMEAGRPARVLHHLTQGADHPVSMFHPEGAYLKGLVLHLT